MIVYLATIAAYDVTNAATLTLYYSTGTYNSGPSDTPPNQFFDPRLDVPALMSRHMFSSGRTSGPSRTSTGDLVLLNPDGDLDGLLDYAYDGRVVTIYRGENIAAFPSGFTTMLVATMAGPPELTEERILFRLRDRQAELDIPVQSTLYDGSNALPAGLEGVDDLKGKPKPLCFGKVRNVSPPMVNTAKLIYQIHDGDVSALDSVEQVYDRGVPLGTTPFGWDSQTSGVATQLNDIAHNGSGTFVVVGASGVIRYSTDGGVNWTAATTPSFSTTDVHSIAYSSTLDRWVAGGASGKLAYSDDDGDTWTQITGGSNPFGATEIIRTIAWGTGPAVFVAGGSLGILASSSNGTSFTSRTTSMSDMDEVVWGRDQFVMLGDSIGVETSPDGVTWTAQPNLPSSVPIDHVGYGAGLYVAVDGNSILVSEDAVSWIRRSAGITGQSFERVRYGGEARLFWAIGGTGSATVSSVFTSPDGLNWTARSSTFGSSIAYGIAADDTDVIVVGAGGKVETPGVAGTYASEADLLDDDLAPDPGTYKAYLAGGYIRLGSSPVGAVTVDATHGDAASDRTAGQLMTVALTQAGMTSADWSAADITAIDAANAAVCGYWTGLERVTASDVISALAIGIGAWWGFDRTGTFRTAVVTDPADDDATDVDFEITQHDMKVGSFRRVIGSDPGGGLPTYRTVLRYNRNHTVHTDLADSVTEANRADLAEPWQETDSTDATVQTPYILARTETIESRIATASDADTEVARVQTLRGARRDVFAFTLPEHADFVSIDIGDLVKITHPRFGFTSGVQALVVSVTPNANRFEIDVEVWK